MQERDNKPDPKPRRWSRFSKTASFWILIIATAFLITQVLQPAAASSRRS
jgi:hypothetical protein